MDCIAKWVGFLVFSKLLRSVFSSIMAWLLSRFIVNNDQMLFLLWCLSELEAALLKELDPQLHSHLVTDSMERLTFCHRFVSVSLFALSFSFSFCHFIGFVFVFHSGGFCWVSSGSLSTAMLCVCLRFSAVITWSSSHSRWIVLGIRRDWRANTAWVRVLSTTFSSLSVKMDFLVWEAV